jgi:hypothetical protein
MTILRKATLISVLGVSLLVANAHAAFRAGVAVRVVNPDPMLPVSGGAGPSHPATNRVGDLTVRAVVMDNGGTRVAVASADFLGFPAILGNKVRAAVATVIPPENVLIGATHTHSAPDCYGFPDDQGRSGASPQYLQVVCTKMAEAIREASDNLREATLKTATGEARGKIAYNAYAESLFDPRCHVLQFVDTSGKPMITLVNYAIHPEVIGSERGMCSPDLIGPLYDRIREKGGGTGIFINSAQGGMVTADNRLPDGGEASSWDECQRIGNLLADEALRILSAAPPQASPNLQCAVRRVTFPVDSPLMRELLKHLPGYADGSGSTVTAQINLLNLGDAQIVTIPGEALPNIGAYLKRKMRGKHNLLFGLTNDAYGYILTKEDFQSFKRYDYISRTSLGERTGEILVNEVVRLVQDNPAP